MIFLNEALSTTRLCNRASLVRPRRSSRGLLIRTRLTCGHSDFAARLLLLQELIPGFAGHITRSSRTTAGGTEQTPITILAGTTPFTTAWATRAGMIRLSLAMISSMEVTPLARQLATMAAPTRLEWLPVQNGSVAVTWTRAMAHRPDTSSAWNFSWRLTRSAAHPTKAIRPRRLI
jgi:hypothetical protein